MTEEALSRYRICDFTGQLAGAGATKWLAAFGAEVIRIEDPVAEGRWDILRLMPPFVDERRGVDFGGGFFNHNTEKLGITLNLRTDEGKDLLRRLVEESDVVTENFAKGVLERWGFGYDELKAINPDIIYVSNCGFGHEGPYAEFKTWGPIVQAMGGLTFTAGLPDEEPSGWGYSYMDHTGAMYMAIAILMALLHRERTGQGQWVDMACTEAALTLHGPALLDWTVNGRPVNRPGMPNGNRSLGPDMAPHGVFPAEGDDHWVAIVCRDDDDWESLGDVVDEPWTADDRFATVSGRKANEADLETLVAGWTSGQDKFAVQRRLLEVGVPAAAVQKPDERIDHDPDTERFGLWPEATHAKMGTVRCDGLPVHLSKTDWHIERGGPCLGEHTDHVLGELLGLDDTEIADLRERGVVLTALTGITVIELVAESTAFAGKLLADMGADVILVEPPQGSPARQYPPFVDDQVGPDRSLHWWHYHTSKRGITLDLDDDDGRDLLARLVRRADVLLDAEPVGRLDERGLGFDALEAANPALVQCSITAFGQASERDGDPVTDLTILAGGGPLWSCGYSDHDIPPIRGGGFQGYNIAAHYAVMATLTALLHRETSGEGQFIDVSQHAAANITTEMATYHWMIQQSIVQRQTGRHATERASMPTQVQCADGRYVNTGVLPRNPKEFAGLLRWIEELGLEDELPEAVFVEMGANRERLELSDIGRDDETTVIFGAAREAMALIATRVSAYDYFVGAQRAGIAVGVVYSPEEAFEDEHFVARGFQHEVDHDGRVVRYPGAPYRFEKTPWTISRRAPRLGEHNDEVLGSLD